MKYACILIFMTIALSGTTLSNKAESIPEKEIQTVVKEDSINIDPIADRVQKLDSIFSELKSKKNDKSK